MGAPEGEPGPQSSAMDEVDQSDLRSQLAVAFREAKSAEEERKNAVLLLESERAKAKRLELEIDKLKRNTVSLQATVEQEEEFISNQLLKKIQQLKKEKEALAVAAELEEEYLTNTLQKKLDKVRQEKAELEKKLKIEQDFISNHLQKQLGSTRSHVTSLQDHLEQLKREKVELERQVEAEQELMVNRLQRRLAKLEAQRRTLQAQLSLSPHPSCDGGETDKSELQRLKALLAQNESRLQDVEEDRTRLHYENLHLRQRVHREVDKINLLAMGMTRIENELEMEEEKQFNVLKPRTLETTSRSSTSSPPQCAQIETRPSASSLGGNTSARWWTKRSEPKSVPSSRKHSCSSTDGTTAPSSYEHSNCTDAESCLEKGSCGADCAD